MRKFILVFQLDGPTIVDFVLVKEYEVVLDAWNLEFTLYFLAK